ncbi:hypothetical protein P4H50_25815, partial [Paenibacillus apiarius]|uniref:hypothetical protein n=1 Tax=Paenibacillus apiarius TaxID=46240 RepID=UPI002DBD8E24
MRRSAPTCGKPCKRRSPANGSAGCRRRGHQRHRDGPGNGLRHAGRDRPTRHPAGRSEGLLAERAPAA